MPGIVRYLNLECPRPHIPQMLRKQSFITEEVAIGGKAAAEGFAKFLNGEA
jgi:hypothetical protein